jgi:Glycosyltransferase
VLRNSDIAPDHVYTVHIQLPFRLPSVTADAVSATLRRFELVADQFLLYPANFWAHKNHQMLLTAYGMHHARYSESVLKLVCTGAPGPRLDYFREAAMAMGLADKVVFPGFIDDSELAALMASCKAVIFPSLFEGFGMPILEAMAAGKPVLCSNVTSLPEIAGDAALLFDPKRPTEIADAIRRIASDSFLVQELIDKGKQRVMAFGDAQKMAQQYWDVFLTAMNSVCNKDALHGVYPDGWCSERVHIVHQRSETARELALELSAPPWLPYRELTIKLFISDGEVLRYKLQRGGQLSIHRELPSQGGIVEMTIAPIFQPKALNINDDTRVLGCQMQSCSQSCPIYNSLI